jgi:hypothetical protein
VETEEEEQFTEDEPVRQRLGVSQHMQPQPQPPLQHATDATVGVVSSTSDSYKNWLIWFLVVAIIFLIYRRVFLM